MAEREALFEARPPGVMLIVAGRRFACACGANVFSKVDGEYRCNGCERRYA